MVKKLHPFEISVRNPVCGRYRVASQQVHISQPGGDENTAERQAAQAGGMLTALQREWQKPDTIT